MVPPILDAVSQHSIVWLRTGQGCYRPVSLMRDYNPADRLDRDIYLVLEDFGGRRLRLARDR